jgi:hypothetical protein
VLDREAEIRSEKPGAVRCVDTEQFDHHVTPHGADIPCGVGTVAHVHSSNGEGERVARAMRERNDKHERPDGRARVHQAAGDVLGPIRGRDSQ